MEPFRLSIVLGTFLVFHFATTYTANAGTPCTSDEDCAQLYSDHVGRTTDGWERPVKSVCLQSGTCSNPFHGGCLRLFGKTIKQRTKFRVCNSDDHYIRSRLEKRNTSWANTTIEALHDCTARPNELNYPEIRIHNSNWESSLFLSWIYQIVLSEIMNVPTTVGLKTGDDTGLASFYSLENQMHYSERTYPYWALQKSNEVKDGNCSKTRDDCCNVLPEVWSPAPEYLPLVINNTVESPIANGQVTRTNYFIPDFTATEYPFLAIHYGYQGEESRKFLAETFKRPLTWLQYCEEVSNSSCTVPDETAARPPSDGSTEVQMYFWQGEYKGYFQENDKNDCDANPTECTGHMAAPPCEWNIYPNQQFYWNDIVGLEPVHYDSLAVQQIWRAAHATKSHVIVGWYQPEVIVQEFFNTDARFQEVSFPPPTDVCVTKRVTKEERCTGTLEEKRGDEEGACGMEIKSLVQLVASSLRINEDKREEAEKSPSYEFIKNIRISELDINRIFQKWLVTYNQGDKYGNDARMAVCDWVVEHYEDLQMFIPSGHPRQLSSTSQYQAWYVSLAQVCGILCGFVSVVAMTLVIRYRETKVIVFAQPLFLLLILLGFLSVCTGAALLAVEPTEELCISVTWFVLLGYSIELIPVLVKTSAINKLIQSSKKAKRVNIKRSRLILDVAIAISFVLTYLVCWTVIDPPGRYEIKRISVKDPTIVELDLRCSSDMPFWRIAAFVWEIMLLVMAALLAFQSRNVLKEFNESNTLGVMVYSHMLFMVIRGIFQILYLGGNFSYAAIASLLSFNYSFDALVSMCIYVFPKLAEARKNPISYLESKLRKRTSQWTSDTSAPEDDLKLLVCTANIGNAEPTQESMESWIPLRGSCKVVTNLDNVHMRGGNFDIIAIGMQESTWTEKGEARQQKKEVSEEDVLNAMEEHHTAILREMLQEILGEGYSEVAEDQRGQMRLYIWASNAVVDNITNVSISGANTGIGNVLANKGGIVITITYKTTRISFLSAHLAAHEGEVYYKARCDNLKTILKESKTFFSSKLDPAISSHHMFVMGDLNFRTRFDDDGKHDDHVARAKQFIEMKDYAGLYEYDELQQGLAKGDMLVGFNTLPCNFPPTFKVQREAGFVYKEQRVPSYTDRILFKSAMGLSGNLLPLAYEPCVGFITSDHKPIRGAFSLIPNDVADTALSDVDVRLTFSRMECSDLPSADTNGLSDPYLLFLWDSINLQSEKTSFKDRIRKLVNGTSWPRTKTIFKTLNPVWEGESVNLFAKNAKIESHAMLWVLAMDSDLLAIKDDFLGGLALNLRDVASMKNGETEKTVFVERDLERGGKYAGRIKFQVDVQLHSRKGTSAPLKMDDDIL